MSRLLRQRGQLARLTRTTHPFTTHRALRLFVDPRLPIRAGPQVYGVRPRYFATQPPEKGEGKQPKDEHTDGKEREAATSDEHQSKTEEQKAPEEEKPRPPLPEGWIYLSKDELTQMSKYAADLPAAPKKTFELALKDMEVAGAPEDIRELLSKLRQGQKLSILEKGRMMRCVFLTAERIAAIQIERENRDSAKDKDGQEDGKAAEGSEQSSETKDSGAKPKGKGPGSETSWADIVLTGVLTLAISGFLLPDLFFGSEKMITWQEVQRDYLEKGLVRKMTIMDNTKVLVELHSDATMNEPAGRPRGTLAFNIGSVDMFYMQLEQAQDRLSIPSNERIPVEFEFGSRTLTNTLFAFGPTLIIMGILLWTQRSMGGRGGAGGGMFSFGKSKARKFNADTAVKVKFADVAGLEEAKTEVMEFVSFLKHPAKFEKLGAKIPRGAILAGPPGTGKTLLAKATAGESGVPFFSVSGSEFVEMFVGVGPSRVRDLFAEGRKNAPCIIFIDEIDAIGRARQDSGKGFGGNDEREATLNQILTEMDGFNTREQVVVLAGTNRADMLDKALMRPGRFDRHIYIDRPTMPGREEIFKVYLKKIVTNEDIDYLVGRLATLTPGFSGADISNVVNEAALIAARDNADDVKMDHFERAIERVVAGLERKSLVLRPEEKKTVAYHEAGHAICGWYLQYADPLLKVSIMPRGQGALGYAQYLPTDAYLLSTNQLMDRMAMTMGGRVSEELHFPTVTTGASDDFKKVSQIARNMVTQWGMSEKVGPVHFENDPNRFQKPFAESTAQQIDQEVSRIVEEAYARCRDLLTEKKKEVGLVAEELLQKEVLVRDDMVRLLGKRPFGDNEDFEKYFGGSKEESGPPPPPSETTPPPMPDGPTPSPAFKQITEGHERR